jgi:ABC-type uncharacterized transport system permease subunit
MPTAFLHILLAVVTTSVFTFAGIQALLLALQDRQLNHKTQISWLNKLPPLERMEAQLFDSPITQQLLLLPRRGLVTFLLESGFGLCLLVRFCDIDVGAQIVRLAR